MLAAGVIADSVIDVVGEIGRRIRSEPLPDRRIRAKARIVKRAISKYNARGPNIDHATYKAVVSIEMLTTAT